MIKGGFFMKQIKAISMATTIIYLVDLILCMLSILVLVFLSIILGGTADSVINHPGGNLVGVLFWLLAGGAAIVAVALIIIVGLILLQYIIPVIFGFRARKKSKFAMNINDFQTDSIVKIVCNIMPCATYTIFYLVFSRNIFVLLWTVLQVTVIVLSVVNLVLISKEKK